MDNSKKWEVLKEVLQEKEENDLNIDEFFIALDSMGFTTHEIVYQDRPLKSTPEQLEYHKRLREKKKLEKAIEDKEERNAQIIKRGLERAELYCLRCRKMVKVINPTHSIKQKRHSTKKNVTLNSNCPTCQTKLGGFIGVLEG